MQFFYLHSKHTGEEQLDDIIRCEVNRFHRLEIRLIINNSRLLSGSDYILFILIKLIFNKINLKG